MAFEDILLNVKRPARYLGNEWNVKTDKPQKAYIRFALCFPDIYEVGMSNLGLRILYAMLNNIEDVSCERVFHPATDMEQLMRQNKMRIFSLESKKDLSEFDIIGFSLGYELAYTNVLNILDLAGIPLSSDLRTDEYPLIIAGGSCALNPEPMADFIDLFLIGEAEEAMLEIVSVYRRLKQNNRGRRPPKKEVLAEFKYIPGVYVPSFYEIHYNEDKTIKDFSPKEEGVPAVVKKRFIKDLDSSFYPREWLLPYVDIVHDRITLETMRGCPNKCRFCQARAAYFPYRNKTSFTIMELARAIYRNTGYEEISLGGLSVSDFGGIDKLVTDLIGMFKDNRVSISLASIRAREVVKSLIPALSGIKKTGLTFAPEAATERLRRTLNKDLDLDTFFSVIDKAFKYGYRHIKLYFLIGLPTEEYIDLDGIIDFSCAVSDLKKNVDKKPAKINVSVANLIPKPHTPFQWLAMEDIEGIEKKQRYLKSRLAKLRLNGRINLSFHNRFMSFVEGFLSRADRRASRVIFNAWQMGAKFDAWDDFFSFERWIKAMQQEKIDPGFYIGRRISKSEILPWDFIDTGISKESLWSDLSSIPI